MKRALFAGAALFIAAVVSTTAVGLNHEGHEESKMVFDPSRSSWFNLQSGALPTKQPTAQSVADIQPMVAKYCFGCHNTRNPLPAGLPLALDTANFADPGADALTWERVVKKLGVGAMPPLGSPTPGHEELKRFRSAPIASLDAAAAQTNSPGRFDLPRRSRHESETPVA